jgi:hypothetical protein
MALIIPAAALVYIRLFAKSNVSFSGDGIPKIANTFVTDNLIKK